MSSSSVVVPSTSSIEEDERLRVIRHHAPFDVENWCDLLPHNATFPTYTFPLSFLDASSIVAFYRVKVLRHTSVELTESHETAIAEIQQRLEILMKQHPSPSGYFVRLSSRSPKDSCLCREFPLSCTDRFQKILVDRLLAGQSAARPPLSDDDDDGDSDVNREFVALMTSSCEAQQVRTAEEAMEMLLYSERIFKDLLLLCDFEELFEEEAGTSQCRRPPVQVIVRTWEDNMPYAFEFRGFVYENQLTALSQYNSMCYFPVVVRHKDAIQKRIVRFFESVVRPNLEPHGLTRYICDFGIVVVRSDDSDDGDQKWRLDNSFLNFDENDDVVVIELNAFDDVNDPACRGTDAGCFSWDEDLALLQGHGGPSFQFRVVEAPPFGSLEGQVSGEWMWFLEWAKREVVRKRLVEEEVAEDVSSRNAGKCSIM